MCGQGNYWNVLGLPAAFQTPGRFPAVNDRHFEVHEDDIRLLGCRPLSPSLAVLGRETLKITKKLKPHFEHIHVVVIVFDIKHFDHGGSIPVAACWARWEAFCLATRACQRRTHVERRSVDLEQKD